MMIPAYTHFKLASPIDHAPAGATGQLKRLDSYHVALIFDEFTDLVFDVNDTEPEVWAAIQPHTVSPSLTDPPWYKAAVMSLASLVVTTPIAMAIVHFTGAGAVLTFGLGIAWKATRYGWRGALPLAVASLIADHLFILTPDNLTLLPTSLFEWYVLAGLFFLAFVRDIGERIPIFTE